MIYLRRCLVWRWTILFVVVYCLRRKNILDRLSYSTMMITGQSFTKQSPLLVLCAIVELKHHHHHHDDSNDEKILKVKWEDARAAQWWFDEESTFRLVIGWSWMVFFNNEVESGWKIDGIDIEWLKRYIRKLWCLDKIFIIVKDEYSFKNNNDEENWTTNKWFLYM